MPRFRISGEPPRKRRGETGVSGWPWIVASLVLTSVVIVTLPGNGRRRLAERLFDEGTSRGLSGPVIVGSVALLALISVLARHRELDRWEQMSTQKQVRMVCEWISVAAVAAVALRLLFDGPPA